LNDVQHFEAARSFAERVLRDGGSAVDERLQFAWRLALARRPAPEELAVLRETLVEYQRRYQADEAAARSVLNVGESDAAGSMAVPELAAYTLVCNLILNLDETITRN
jgi:hypothetical protein